MTEEKTTKTQSSKSNIKIWSSGLIGLVIGFLLCGIIMFTVMPSMMIVTKKSKLGFDETVETLQKRISENGWQVSRVMSMNKSISKHGYELKPKVTLIKLCHPEYARDILTTDRYVSCMMPCTMAVWQGDDGKVYLSEMNMGLMAKIFGGNISKIMGGKVVKDEEKMLEGLLKK
jgi:uncharacterized protein (DUF302 family)